MATYRFRLNGKSVEVESPADRRLLWVIRDQLGLTGTKYSCGMGLCGCCTVLLDGKAVRSCITSIGKVSGRDVVTIEHFAADKTQPLVAAWLEEEVSQCGYCQPGQILIAHDLLQRKPRPSDADIDDAMNKALCRCGTYNRVRRAIHRVAAGGGS